MAILSSWKLHSLPQIELDIKCLQHVLLFQGLPMMRIATTVVSKTVIYNNDDNNDADTIHAASFRQPTSWHEEKQKFSEDYSMTVYFHRFTPA